MESKTLPHGLGLEAGAKKTIKSSSLVKLEKLLKKYGHFQDYASGKRAKIIKIYSIIVASTSVGLLLGYYTQLFTNIMVSFFFLVVGVGISAWFGGRKGGLVSLSISFVGVIVFFVFQNYHHINSLVSILLPLGIFLIEGVIISVISERSLYGKEIKELRRKEDDFSQIIIYQQDVYEKAKQEIKSRDEFLSIASHELKTPLTSMLLKIQYALRSIRTVSLANFSVENLMNMLESAEQQTMHLSRMINDLLSVSLLTTGRVELDLEEVDLGEIVETVIERFSEKLKQDGYTVNLHLSKGIKGKWDRIRLEQIISNLLSNAIKYGNHKPITFTVERKNDKAVLSIEDQGIGIQNKDFKRIFELFERSVGSKDYKGLGVGLYITNQLVRAHKGKLQVESAIGKGSKFIIILPFPSLPSFLANKNQSLPTAAA